MVCLRTSFARAGRSSASTTRSRTGTWRSWCAGSGAGCCGVCGGCRSCRRRARRGSTGRSGVYGDELLVELAPASVQGRAALGERAGEWDQRVGRGMQSELFVKGPLCADGDGFSLDAAMRVQGRDPSRCRHAARRADRSRSAPNRTWVEDNSATAAMSLAMNTTAAPLLHFAACSPSARPEMRAGQCPRCACSRPGSATRNARCRARVMPV